MKTIGNNLTGFDKSGAVKKIMVRKMYIIEQVIRVQVLHKQKHVVWFSTCFVYVSHLRNRSKKMRQMQTNISSKLFFKKNTHEFFDPVRHATWEYMVTWGKSYACTLIQKQTMGLINCLQLYQYTQWPQKNVQVNYFGIQSQYLYITSVVGVLTQSVKIM